MPRPDKFVCPACGRKFKVNGRVAGKKTTCIGCGVSLYFTADGTLSTLPVQSRGSPPAPSRKAEGPSPDWLPDVDQATRSNPLLIPTKSPADDFGFDSQGAGPRG